MKVNEYQKMNYEYICGRVNNITLTAWFISMVADGEIVNNGNRVYIGVVNGDDVYVDIKANNDVITISFVVDYWRGGQQIIFTTSNKEEAAKYILAKF